LESRLTIIGATAIEDKLQENLIQTLNLLKVANIKIWVITGDKTETAKNIAYSSELFD
jgi:P-type E1-E2 ATPase